MALKHFQELIVWQKAMDLAVLVYETTRSFPREEIFGLTHQIRKAVVSIPSNIAEGQGRHSTKDFLHFLAVARGSLQELITQIILAKELCYCQPEQSEEILSLATEVARLLHGLINSLSEKG